MNGGVGDAQAAYMQSVAKNWPVRIMFSQLKANEYVADVKLLITNGRQATMLELDGAGPLTYVELPAGKYKVSAVHEGQTQTRQISIGKGGQSNLHFHWKGTAKMDPYDGKPLGGVQVPG